MTLFCVLGDAHLDVVVCPDGPVAEETDTPARTWVGAGRPGRQRGGVDHGPRRAGPAHRGPGHRPGRPAGRQDLRARGVDLHGPVLDGPTGVVVSLSHDGVSRSMLTDRGVGPRLSEDTLDDGWLAGCGLLHLPAYSLTRAPVSGAALAAAARVPRLSVDLSSTAVLNDYGVARFRALLGRLRPEIVFGTEAEADLIGELDGTDLAGTDLVVKLGARGVRAGGTEYPAHPVDAVDSTGAGDAFAAGYLVGGVAVGLAAAARAVAKMGAMP